jgi:hypothetical protein
MRSRPRRCGLHAVLQKIPNWLQVLRNSQSDLPRKPPDVRNIVAAATFQRTAKNAGVMKKFYYGSGTRELEKLG